MSIFPQATAYCPRREQAIVEQIMAACGTESYRPRLDVISSCLEAYQQFLPPHRVIIAGTNGKGQVASELAYYLAAGGVSHSLLLSPHVLSLTERLSYGGKNIAYEELAELVQRALKRFKGEDLSFYELLLLAFVEGHCQRSVEVMVMEVGLGGRFDGVNAIDPTLSAVVSIGRDHVEVLGQELPQILWEKLGITRSGVPLFISIAQGALRRLCREYCRQHGIPLKDLWQQGVVGEGQPYGERNSRLAHALAEQVMGSRPRLSHIATRGRWQRVGRFSFVSAHNGDGLWALRGDPRLANFKGMIFSCSERGEGQLEQMMEALASLGREIGQGELCACYFSLRPHFKKLGPDKWRVLEQWSGLEFIDSFYPPSEGEFLVTGSNYFIGEFQKDLLS